MPITLRCPRCGEIRIVADDAAGDTVTCGGCSATLRIPNRPSEMAFSAAPVENINPFADRAVAPIKKAQETENPYQAPAFTPQFEPSSPRGFAYRGPDPRLAGRGKRFVGAILDSLFIAGPLIAISIIADVNRANNDFLLAIGLIIAAIVLLIDTVMISMQGQSLAKYLLGMQIVKTDSDELPGFVHGILLRSFVPGIIGSIPLVGGIFSLVDPL